MPPKRAIHVNTWCELSSSMWLETSLDMHSGMFVLNIPLCCAWPSAKSCCYKRGHHNDWINVLKNKKIMEEFFITFCFFPCFQSQGELEEALYRHVNWCCAGFPFQGHDKGKVYYSWRVLVVVSGCRRSFSWFVACSLAVVRSVLVKLVVIRMQDIIETTIEENTIWKRRRRRRGHDL